MRAPIARQIQSGFSGNVVGCRPYRRDAQDFAGIRHNGKCLTRIGHISGCPDRCRPYCVGNAVERCCPAALVSAHLVPSTMPFPIDVTRCLAFTETNTPLRVCTIPFDALRAKLAARGLREGDEIIVDVVNDGHVVVAKLDGKRILVERQYAVLVEVERRTPSMAVPSRCRSMIRKPLVAVGT